jgi:hypothetical protein
VLASFRALASHLAPTARATVSNIGSVHDALGDRQEALRFCGQGAPAIQSEVDDRAGEAVARYNMAMVLLRAEDRLGEAVRELQQVFELDRQVQHPDLEADTATLREVIAQLTHGRAVRDDPRSADAASSAVPGVLASRRWARPPKWGAYTSDA